MSERLALGGMAQARHGGALCNFPLCRPATSSRTMCRVSWSQTRSLQITQTISGIASACTVNGVQPSRRLKDRLPPLQRYSFSSH